MEATSGVSSVGRVCSGNRTDVASGPIDAALRGISRTGLRPLRIARMPIASVANMSSGLTQMALNTNSRKSDLMRASDPSVRATDIHMGPASRLQRDAQAIVSLRAKILEL